jgi:hypothetical protein
MKMLTVLQPWASLIACGIKQFETRTWKPPAWLVGPEAPEIVIHAGASHRYYDGKDAQQQALVTAGKIPAWQSYIERCAREKTHEIPFGAVIATARIKRVWECIGADCRGDLMIAHDLDTPAFDNAYLSDTELCFGDFTEGRYAWELSDVHLLATPLPVKGRQRLWKCKKGG